MTRNHCSSGLSPRIASAGHLARSACRGRAAPAALKKARGISAITRIAAAKSVGWNCRGPARPGPPGIAGSAKLAPATRGPAGPNSNVKGTMLPIVWSVAMRDVKSPLGVPPRRRQFPACPSPFTSAGGGPGVGARVDPGDGCGRERDVRGGWTRRRRRRGSHRRAGADLRHEQRRHLGQCGDNVIEYVTV